MWTQQESRYPPPEEVKVKSHGIISIILLSKCRSWEGAFTLRAPCFICLDLGRQQGVPWNLMKDTELKPEQGRSEGFPGCGAHIKALFCADICNSLAV